MHLLKSIFRKIISHFSNIRRPHLIVWAAALLLCSASIAQAFSFPQFVQRIRAGIAAIQGSGTINQVAVFASGGTNTIGDSIIYASPTAVGIDTATPDAKLRVKGGDIRVDANQSISSPGRLNLRAEAGGGLYLDSLSGNTYVGYGGGGGDLFAAENLNAAGDVHSGTGNVWMSQLCRSDGTNCPPSSSQWVTSGSNIYYNAGNVGIGTTGPGAKLDVNGTWRLQGAAQGNLNMNNNSIAGVSKITVGTVDPLYDIDGVKYATYAPAIAGGVREEYVGRGRLTLQSGGGNDESQKPPVWSYVLDFENVEQGSDLWLWHKAVDFSDKNVEVWATPRGELARIAYRVDDHAITFFGDAPVEFSYRLAGRRFDWRAWPTRSADQGEPAVLIVR